MTLFWFPDSQVAMEAKDSMFDVHAHEDSGESKIDVHPGLSLRQKKDLTHRPVFNLKPFNQFIAYHHFKMAGLNTVVGLLQPEMWMCKMHTFV